MAEKRYWWLKLQEDFFRQKAMKKLRKMERGTTYTIVYLKMQLASLQKNGILTFDHLEESFAEELAYEIDEEPEDVSATVEFLHQCGLLVELSEVERYLPEVAKNTGSEGSSAKRTRDLRERKKQAALHCDDEASLCHGEIEKEKEIEKSKRREEDTAVSSCAEPETVSTPPVITLPLNDGSEYPVSQEQCQEWAGLYPAVDVIQQLRGMRGWLLSNKARRKTKRGIDRFITNWLSREQNQGCVGHSSGERGENRGSVSSTGTYSGRPAKTWGVPVVEL